MKKLNLTISVVITLLISASSLFAQERIVVAIFPNGGEAAFVHGHPTKKVIVTGTLKEILDFTRVTRIITDFCDTLLLPRADRKRVAQEYLAKMKFANEIPPPCVSRPHLCIYIPEAADFLGAIDSAENKDGCRLQSICFTKDNTSVSASCGPFTYEIATDGDINVSTTSGNVTSQVSNVFER
jgi:hypothetical protein